MRNNNAEGRRAIERKSNSRDETLYRKKNEADGDILYQHTSHCIFDAALWTRVSLPPSPPCRSAGVCVCGGEHVLQMLAFYSHLNKPNYCSIHFFSCRLFDRRHSSSWSWLMLCDAHCARVGTPHSTRLNLIQFKCKLFIRKLKTQLANTSQ